MCMNSTGVGQGRNQTLFTYSPNKKFNETFDFVDHEIARIDDNKDGVLNLKEFSSTYGGDMFTAKYYMDILDRNQDHKIDTTEATAYLVLTDKDADDGSSDGKISREEAMRIDEHMMDNPDAVGEDLDKLINEAQADKNNKSATLQERYDDYKFTRDLSKQIFSLNLEPDSDAAKQLMELVGKLQDAYKPDATNSSTGSDKTDKATEDSQDSTARSDLYRPRHCQLY